MIRLTRCRLDQYELAPWRSVSSRGQRTRPVRMTGLNVHADPWSPQFGRLSRLNKKERIVYPVGGPSKIRVFMCLLIRLEPPRFPGPFSRTDDGICTIKEDGEFRSENQGYDPKACGKTRR